MQINHIRAFFLLHIYIKTLAQVVIPSLMNTELDFFLFSCLDNTPELTKWTERMLEDPAVKATIHSLDTYKAFYKSYADGKPQYDYGL